MPKKHGYAFEQAMREFERRLSPERPTLKEWEKFTEGCRSRLIPLTYRNIYIEVPPRCVGERVFVREDRAERLIWIVALRNLVVGV